jgi:hypothetical protein
LWNELVAEAQYLGDWVNENIISPIEDKFADFLDVGKNIINNVWEGMKSAWQSVTSWFTGAWDAMFSGKSKSMKFNEATGTWTFAKNGLDYVPYDGFPIIAHEGEAVLTKEEATAWRAGKSMAKNNNATSGSSGSSSGISIVQNISAVVQSPVQFASATAAYFEQARWAL